MQQEKRKILQTMRSGATFGVPHCKNGLYCALHAYFSEAPDTCMKKATSRVAFSE